MNAISFSEVSHHPKGWGEEVWVINCPQYCLKFLLFKAGSKGSLHFHEKKQETWYIESGKLDLEMIDTTSGLSRTVNLFSGDIVHIPQFCPHRVSAVTDVKIIEVSTQHFEDDSFRIKPGDSQNVT